MAKSSKKKKFEKIPFQQMKFVFNNLDVGQLKQYDDNPLTAEKMIDALCDFAEEGAKVSIQQDTYTGNGVQAIASFVFADSQNAGYQISGRGRDSRDALGILAFKYFVCAERDLSQFDFDLDEDVLRG